MKIIASLYTQQILSVLDITKPRISYNSHNKDSSLLEKPFQYKQINKQIDRLVILSQVVLILLIVPRIDKNSKRRFCQCTYVSPKHLYKVKPPYLYQLNGAAILYQHILSQHLQSNYSQTIGLILISPMSFPRYLFSLIKVCREVVRIYKRLLVNSSKN